MGRTDTAGLGERGKELVVSGSRFLRRPAVEARTGLARSTIYQWMAEGHFPRCITLGPKQVVWLEREIDDWMAAKVAARAAGPGSDQ